MKKIIVHSNYFYCFLFSLLGLPQFVSASQDSLLAVWQNESAADSSRVQAYRTYLWNGYLFSKPDSAISLADNLINYADYNQYPQAKAEGFNIKGIANTLLGSHNIALDYFQRNLAVFEKLKDTYHIAIANNNIGNIYKQQSVHIKALDYYKRSLKLYGELGLKDKLAGTALNIAGIYIEKKDYEKAREYTESSLKTFEELGDDVGKAISLMAMGENYYATGSDLPKAMDYLKQSLSIVEAKEEKRLEADALVNIAKVLKKQNDLQGSLSYLERALNIQRALGSNAEIAGSLIDMGLIYQNQKNYTKALRFCKEGFEKSKEYNILIFQEQACQCLYDNYKATGNGNEALVYLEKLKVINDSLKTEESTKKLLTMEFEKEALKTEKAHNQEVDEKNTTRNYLIIAGILALLLASGIFARLRRTRKAKALVEKEKDLSENLLLNILPSDIAEELKTYGKSEARSFDQVSILFTDFKGFTETSEKLSPQELVEEINECFKAFDTICEKHKVEKIKTIGDAYMAASGLPIPGDDTAKNSVLAALEMQHFIMNRKQNNDLLGKPSFQMRSGIHTGPIVAGIIGVKKFQYDVWGDTVNTASRMESNGEVAKVNISETTYELLKNDEQFRFEKREAIEVKGKGSLNMYFVSLLN